MAKPQSAHGVQNTKPKCPACGSSDVVPEGVVNDPADQLWRCEKCGKVFTDKDKVLFTKDLWTSCQEIKRGFDLEALGIVVEELSPDNPAALAHLTWYECVELAEKSPPLLIVGG